MSKFNGRLNKQPIISSSSSIHSYHLTFTVMGKKKRTQVFVRVVRFVSNARYSSPGAGIARESLRMRKVRHARWLG